MAFRDERMVSRAKIRFGQKSKRGSDEHNIQCAIIKYLDLALPGTIRAVGVSNNPRSKIAGALEKAMGMRRGFPDILLIGTGDMGEDFAGLIEVKKEGGRLTKDQREWQGWCGSIGFKHAVCRSVDDARETLEEWGVI